MDDVGKQEFGDLVVRIAVGVGLPVDRNSVQLLPAGRAVGDRTGRFDYLSIPVLRHPVRLGNNSVEVQPNSLVYFSVRSRNPVLPDGKQELYFSV